MGYTKWDFDGEARQPRQMSGELTIDGIACGPATITFKPEPILPFGLNPDGSVVLAFDVDYETDTIQGTLDGFFDDPGGVP